MAKGGIMYYAFNGNGECVASGELEFQLEGVSIVFDDKIYDISIINLVNGKVQVKQELGSTDKTEVVDSLNTFTSLQVDLMETMAELNEVILLSANDTESKV